ncbi:MAG: alkene reductase [Bacteroidota bacterium]
MILFDAYEIGSTSLKNRIVMAPLTRCRATADHIPTDLMATYYSQRAGAGLIITEGTAPSPNGAGYARIPGIYNQEQTAAWKKVTDAVHEANGKIFLQLMHTGRVSHKANMPENARVLAPSAIELEETKMYVDGEGELPTTAPKAMSSEEITATINEYVKAAQNAIKAGFDGVEVHGANGYLIEQFISPTSNQRSDEYGGSIEARCKFAIEVAQRVSDAIGKERVGIRLSPYGVMNEVGFEEAVEETFVYLAKQLREIGLTYIHIADHESMGAPEVPNSIKEKIAQHFGGTIILSGGYNREQANQDLENKLGHLVAFGRPYIANPDLALRLEHDEVLAQPDPDYFYTPGEKGYTDYAILEHHLETT